MIDLGDIESAITGRAQTALLIGAVILCACLLCSAGVGWWLAAEDRDEARSRLVQEQRDNAELRGSLKAQNEAVAAMQLATAQAQDRGRAAQQAAEAAGRRYDAGLKKIGAAHAATCADAMPAVNALLESVL